MKLSETLCLIARSWIKSEITSYNCRVNGREGGGNSRFLDPCTRFKVGYIDYMFSNRVKLAFKP